MKAALFPFLAISGAALVALAVGVPPAETVLAQTLEVFEESPDIPGSWTSTLNQYVSDPIANGPRLIAIERESGGDLPPRFQVAIADAHLRAGNRQAAERLLEDALAGDPGYPWTDFANLGMGTLRMMSGDPEGAEEYFTQVAAASENSSRALGNLGLGYALASDDRLDEAKAAFDAAATNPSVDAELRRAGQFGSATTLHAAGEYEAAAEAFDAIAAANPDDPIGRDARYAAARARLRLGDREASITALGDVVAGCPPEDEPERVSRSLRDLQPRAIARTWVRNYQSTPWVKLQAKGTSMYSVGGCALARTTLREIENEPAGPSVQQAALAARAPTSDEGAPPASSPIRRARHEPPAPAESSFLWLVFAGSAAAVGTIVFLWRRGRRSGSA